ncbi:MAG: trypsin-like peptidase domain-containing protein [Pirellulales bacterium]|nr:trypsin-like peptidase domain-containing protein [Pirellulales bacterium]
MDKPHVRRVSRLLHAIGFGFICSATGLAALASPSHAHASEARRTAIVRAAQGARESVVNIHGQKTLTAADDPLVRAEGPRRVNGMGTGIIIDERGFILTNCHVVDGVRKIEVTMADGVSQIAQFVSSDPANDLAVIKVSLKEKLPVITVGTSHDLMIGEEVIALGNAYGYEHTVTRGIISALHRSVQVNDTQSYEDLIQTDASINPGNSGGPLLNIDGEMIAVNVAVRAGAQGIGFAIPIDKAMSVAAKLMSTERVEQKWHGVKLSDMPGRNDGAVVMAIEADSPASKSGLRPGDVVTAVDHQPISRAVDFERALLGQDVGKELDVTVRRNNAAVTTNLELAALPSQQVEPTDDCWELLGLKLQPIPTPQFQQYQSRYRGGLAIAAVRPDGPAAKQGIRRGDILVGMHIWETVTLENVEYILNRSDFADFEPVKFYILRGSDTLYGHLPVAARQ